MNTLAIALLLLTRPMICSGHIAGVLMGNCARMEAGVHSKSAQLHHEVD
jgi:hypothetical protein